MALRRACAFPQGLGLYAARDIEKHTMVIEYIGTIIRNEVANRKEKLYESQVSSRPPVPSGAWGQGWVCPWKPPLERPVFPPVTVCEAVPATSEPGFTGDLPGVASVQGDRLGRPAPHQGRQVLSAFCFRTEACTCSAWTVTT